MLVDCEAPRLSTNEKAKGKRQPAKFAFCLSSVYIHPFAQNSFLLIELTNRHLVGEDMEQKGYTLWFTGLSGAGKTTLARIIETELKARGQKVEVLDGD